MALFKKKEAGPSLEEIRKLREEGLDEAEMISQLEQKGYSFSQINTALSRLEITPEFKAEIPEETAPIPSSQVRVASPEPMPLPEEPSQADYSKFEEIAEEIINEKWEELIGEVKKIIAWKEKMEGEINNVISEMEHLKEDFKTLQQGILGKISEYDERMKEVGIELKAVGEVFKSTIPVLTENVKELSEVTRKVKGKK